MEINIEKFRKTFFCSKYSNGEIGFSVPLFVQRRMAICTILSESTWNKQIKVADFGCGSMYHFFHIKNLDFVEDIYAVDRCDLVLTNNLQFVKSDLYKSELLFERPLRLTIFEGNVCDKDMRVQNSDVVLCAELIEHLYPNELKKLVSNVFGCIIPKLVIITTPNYEFNACFPDYPKFRDLDHKFEWTRQEFKNWVQDVISLYPDYTVELYGIGPPPRDFENLGFGSQMAVFRLNPDCVPNRNYNISGYDYENPMPYKEVAMYEYDWLSKDVLISNKQLVLRQVEFVFNNLTHIQRCRKEKDSYILVKELINRTKLCYPTYKLTTIIIMKILKKTVWGHFIKIKRKTFAVTY